jgi:DNA ligase (NAD+)
LDLFEISHENLSSLLLDPATLTSGRKTKDRRFGDERATRLLASIEKSKCNKPLSKWLFGLGISQVGETTAREVSRLFRNMHSLANSQLLSEISERGLAITWKTDNPINSKYEEISDPEKTHRQKIFSKLNPRIKELDQKLSPYQVSPELGGVASKNLLDYFNSSAGHDFLMHLDRLKIDPLSDNFNPIPQRAANESLPLAGKTFVITGTLSIDRDSMKTFIESKGGKVSSSISSKTNFVLAGDGGGSKKDTAEKLGVPVINEEKFYQLLKDKLQ